MWRNEMTTSPLTVTRIYYSPYFDVFMLMELDSWFESLMSQNGSGIWFYIGEL
jgi:hypothetical protein